MRVVDMVHFWARTMPARPAVIQPEGIISYGALADAVERAADSFARDIAERQKPVAVSIHNSPRMLVACLGLLRAGFNIVPATESLLEHVPQTGAKTLIHERGGATLAGATNIVFDDTMLTGSGYKSTSKAPLRQRRAPDSATIYFTSGTTGTPKPVVLTQQAWEQRVLFSNNTTFAGYERALIVPALFSAYGLNRAYEILHAGKTMCLAPDVPSMLWLANTYDVDLIIASIQQALMLAETQEKVTRYPLPALKTLRIGGSVISKAGIDRLKSHLCRNIILSYASTEAGTAAMAPYDLIAKVPGAVGYVFPDVDVEIVDHSGNILPVGREGFVRLRSPQFLKGLDEETSASWFYPGDLGSLTEDGILCIAGRTGDVVNRGGAKLSTAEFESFMSSFAGVKDAGVCTVMGRVGHEEVWVGVVIDPSIDIGAFRHHIESNSHFASNIDKLFVVESIPRNVLGKVQQSQLKEMLQGIDQGAPAPP